MRRLITILSITLVTASVHAQLSKEDRLKALAGDCLTEVFASCDNDVYGTLESGDCTTGEGKRVDFITFNGTPGQVLEVMVRPLSPTFKQPIVALYGPLGTVVDGPFIGGGNPSATTNGASLFYKINAPGKWDIAVTSDDLFASGPYVLHVFCTTDDQPQVPQSCIDQYLLCGQTGIWELGADSCRFTTAPKAFARWWIHGVKDDILRIEQSSLSFTPLFGFYDESGKLLRSSSRDTSFTAKMTFRIPETGWYYVGTTTEENNEGGEFSVKVECSGSGCTWPFPIEAIKNVNVAHRGDQAIVPFNVNAVGGFTTQLLDRDNIPVASLNTPTTSITTPPVLRPTTYTLMFSNACGDWITNPFTVAPEPTRRRAVRK